MRPWEYQGRHGPAVPNAVFLYGDSRGSGFVENVVARVNRDRPEAAISGMSVWLAGGRVRTMQPTVDADIASLPAVAPDTGPVVIGLFALGANDLGDVRTAAITEADWITKAQYCLDAFNTKWPGIQVYMLRAWVRDYLAEANTYAGWVASVVASRSFAHLGPDERIVLENGDDGAAYTADGVHYSAAEGGGVTHMVAQWRLAVGL